MWVLRLAYIGLGIALLVGIFLHADAAEIIRLIGEVGVAGVAAVTFLYFLAFLADSISWCLTIPSAANTVVWFRRTFMVRLAGEAFNNLLPAAGFGGEPVKAEILKRRYDIDFDETAASIVIARTINMMALIGFLAVGLALLMRSPSFGHEMRLIAALGFALLSAGTLALFVVQRYRMTSRLVAKIGGGANWATRTATALSNVDQRFHEFYARHRQAFFAAFVLAAMNWVLGVLEILVTFHFLGRPVSFGEAWIIEAVTQMVRAAAFFIPAGLGVQEGAFLIVCGAITGNPAHGLAVSVVRRFREVIWIVLGLAAAILYPTTRRRIGEAISRE